MANMKRLFCWMAVLYLFSACPVFAQTEPDTGYNSWDATLPDDETPVISPETEEDTETPPVPGDDGEGEMAGDNSVSPEAVNDTAAPAVPADDAAKAGDKTPSPDIVTVIGSAPVIKDNMAKAKDAAIASGIIRAVEQASLGLVGPEALAGDFQKFSALVQGKAEDFVASYQVLAEGDSEKQYRVMLQVTVSADRLRTELGGIRPAVPEKAQPENHMPKILFLVAEQNLENLSPRYWWARDAASASETVSEPVLSRKMTEAGFQIVTHTGGPPDMGDAVPLVLQADIENADALVIGKHMGADIVVVGKALVYKVPDTAEGEPGAFNATVIARALRVENGEEIVSLLEAAIRKNEDDTTGGREALAAAGEQAGTRMSGQISTVWQDMIQNENMIEMTVKGTRSLGNFVQFRKRLADMDGVEAIRIQAMKTDEAVISVRFAPGVQKFVNDLKKLTFDLFILEVQETSGKALTVALMPK